MVHHHRHPDTGAGALAGRRPVAGAGTVSVSHWSLPFDFRLDKFGSRRGSGGTTGSTVAVLVVFTLTDHHKVRNALLGHSPFK